MYVDAQQPRAIEDYLCRRGWLDTEERILSVQKPGEGRMNYILRIKTAIRTLIIKQARGYVETAPAVAVPAERAIAEGRFYLKAQAVPMLAERMPLLMGMDEENYLLILEDLGETTDFTRLYQPDTRLGEPDALALTAFLSELHSQFGAGTFDAAFRNQAMRAFNHEHIFVRPFLDDNGVELDALQPGLQEVALPYRRDTELKRRVAQLGRVYLADGSTLLHGDYYPGSWLQTADGVQVIDPEFCFYGPAEFDLGVMLAHLMLADQPAAILDTVRKRYEPPAGFDETLRQRFTGIEIMRRLLGSAQLPLSLSLNQKRSLLEEARSLLV